MTLRIHLAATLDELGGAAADAVLSRLRKAHLQGAVPVLGVATGSSPLSLYRALAQRRDELPPLRAFALDEYLGLPPGHPESYAEVVRREVVEPLGLDAGQVAVPDGSAADPEQAAADYEAAISAAGGVDVQILGIGNNGHLAFNEPGSPLDSRTRVVQLDESTRQANARFFSSLEDVPTQALTQGLGTIRAARSLVLLASGAAKAEALAAALQGPVTEQVPASILQLHPDVTILLADGAGSGLSPDLLNGQAVAGAFR
ncbi:glucosamine-6-phosphate deaminase [Arthrobacter sp. Helios]|uniref:glucosamine-6-phosphate deaminase n=1 Tax=Arthrobacter sp. Helios TaxID=2828862 RepID=UPI0024A64D19|nr:glucosamine-6-phosphate deaminase [Arthrobacter sp. Helios]